MQHLVGGMGGVGFHGRITGGGCSDREKNHNAAYADGANAKGEHDFYHIEEMFRTHGKSPLFEVVYASATLCRRLSAVKTGI